MIHKVRIDDDWKYGRVIPPPPQPGGCGCWRVCQQPQPGLGLGLRLGLGNKYSPTWLWRWRKILDLKRQVQVVRTVDGRRQDAEMSMELRVETCRRHGGGCGRLLRQRRRVMRMIVRMRSSSSSSSSGHLMLMLVLVPKSIVEKRLKLLQVWRRHGLSAGRDSDACRCRQESGRVLYNTPYNTTVFKTDYIETVEFCQDQFGFDKPSVL